MSWSRAAVRPCAALYCDRLQVNESANNTATGERVEIDDGSTNAATIAAARAADTRDRFRFIGVSNERTTACRRSFFHKYQNRNRTPRRAIRAGMTFVT